MRSRWLRAAATGATAQWWRDRPVVALVPSRNLPRTRLGRELPEALADLAQPCGALVLPGISQRIAVAESVLCGLTVREYEGDGSAAKEFAALATKYHFEFDDELSEEELAGLAGGVTTLTASTDLSQQISSMEDDMEAVRNERQESMTMFENYDQKVNQLFNILSTVMKGTKEMQSSITRNML